MLYLTCVAKGTNDDPQPRRLAGLEAVSDPAVDTGEHSAPWMRPAFADAIARRVLDLGSDRDFGQAAGESALLTVAEVAARLNISQSSVYAHKRELGAIRLGSGPKARLRFDATEVVSVLNSPETSVRSGTNGPIEAPNRGEKGT